MGVIASFVKEELKAFLWSNYNATLWIVMKFIRIQIKKFLSDPATFIAQCTHFNANDPPKLSKKST